MIRTANYLMILVTLVVFIAQMSYWYGRLPDPMPSHFDANGQVDGQMGKAAFYALICSLNALFLFGFPILGTLLKRIPDSAINLPNKEYWLAPERRELTLAKNANLLGAVGWMTNWLFIGIVQLTALVAIEARDSISPEWIWLLGMYLVAISLTVGIFVYSFRLPQGSASQSVGNPQIQ